MTSSQPYGLPPGSAIDYGVPWPNPWVDELCRRFGLDSSTYPGHQEGDRPDIGAAPNPNRENRGIDWAGPADRMLAFAKWCVSVGPERQPGVYGPIGLEQVIYQSPVTGERIWFPNFVDYGSDFGGHTDHVHTRQSAALIEDVPPPLSKMDRYALAVIDEGQRRNISRKGICIALTVPFVESGWKMYANSNVPESLNFPHDAVGSDHDSTGLFQQRQAWGPLAVTMDPAGSAGLFYDGGQAGQRGLTDFDYDTDARTPGGWAQAVQVSAYPDRYDQHWGEANALYDRLAGVTEEDDLFSDDDRALLRQVHEELTKLFASRSPYRRDSKLIDTLAGFVLNDDGMEHAEQVEAGARAGVTEDIADIYRVAHGSGEPMFGEGVSEYWRQRAQNVLASITTAPTTPTPQQPTPISPAQPPTPAQPSVNPQVLDGLRAEIAGLREQLTKPSTEVAPVNGQTATTGQAIGRLYDSLEEMRLADALPIEARAPLAALISVLQTKNGTQL